MSQSSFTVTPRDIEQHVEKLRNKNYTHAAVAIRTAAEFSGPDRWVSNGQNIEVQKVSTPLLLRSALRPSEEAAPWRFFLTTLPDSELPLDLQEKLYPYGRVFTPDPSDSLRNRFSATRQHSDVVPSLRDIPELLAYFDSVKANVRPAQAGVLSADHVSRELLFADMFKTYPQATSTLTDLLCWSVDGRAAASWENFNNRVPSTVRERAWEWLSRQLGSDAATAIQYLAKHGPDQFLAYGLVAEILSPAPGMNESQRAGAEGGFRVATGITRPRAAEWTAWSQAAINAYCSAPDDRKSVRHDAQRLAVELGAESLLRYSTVMDAGLDARLDDAAEAIEHFLGSNNTGALVAAHRQVNEHVGLALYARDVATVDACARLAQWLTLSKSPEPTSLSGWLSKYRDELSWVDTCVSLSWWGQSNSRLADAAAKLIQRVRPYRNSADLSFAQSLATSGVSSSSSSEILLVEDILGSVVEPLVKNGNDEITRPMLFLVLDGCSVPAANDLVQSIMSTYPGTWRELLPVENRLRTALAAFPTVTNVSRASLFSGEIAYGGQNEERKGFGKKLGPVGNGANAVTLFHKNDLTAGINDTVRSTVENTTDHPIVAAVLNDIDDSLSAANPLNTTWQVNDIAFLPNLLEGAARVGRTVVLVSDHGHIPERHVSGLTRVSESSSARWRRDDSSDPAKENEIRLRGPRVRANGDDSAILAVDESIRYSARTSGYHGGASLAEACIPVTVLTQTPADFINNQVYTDDVLTQEVRLPSWWQVRENETQTVPVTAKDSKSYTSGQSMLTFEKEQPRVRKDRFDSLLQGKDALLVARYRSYGPPARSVEEFVDVLRVISSNNGRMAVDSLTSKWSLSRITAQGTINKLRQVVNMDGVEVLSVEGTDMVLNADLLFEQFGV